MPNLTIYILYVIFTGFLVIFSRLTYKKFKNYQEPKKDSKFNKQRSYFYAEIFSEKIEPVFINFIKEYFTRFTETKQNFIIIKNFFKNLEKYVEYLADNELDERDRELYKNTLSNLIQGSKTYESIYMNIDTQSIDKWIENFNQLSNYKKCIRNFKILTYSICTCIGVLLAILLIFDFYMAPDIAYIYYLIIIFVILGVLFGYYLYIYFRFDRKIIKIFKKSNIEVIPIK